MRRGNRLHRLELTAGREALIAMPAFRAAKPAKSAPGTFVATAQPLLSIELFRQSHIITEESHSSKGVGVMRPDQFGSGRSGRPAKATAKSRKKRGNQAGRPTAADLERRKARAREVATDLFINHGYAATSLVDIARGAGVATRTLYEHFGDKEAIFREVILARNAGGEVRPPSIEANDTLFSALKRAGRYTHDLTYRDRSIGLMRLMIAESNRFPDFMRTIATTIFARFRHSIELVFQGLEEASLIPPGDHARSAELFTDLVLGSRPIMTYTNWGAAPPSEKDLDQRTELFILGRFGPTVARTARTLKAKKTVGLQES